MRHRLTQRKLNRATPHRKSMLRNLVRSLMEHESIRTTEARAKETRRTAEKMITLGKDGSVHARRQALKFLDDRDTVAIIFDDIAPRYAGRAGGYTRIIKLGARSGDGAAMARLELIAGEA